MASTAARNHLVDVARQSPPVDTKEPYDAAWVAGKTIIITGGASGFGEGFFRKWAENGANVIIGDVNDDRGKALVEEVRKQTGNAQLHYIHCDVTNWQSQVDFFRTAKELSPTKGIDAVVANAGITDTSGFENPENLDAEEPPKPNLKCFDVNLLGVLYTTHLAMWYLPRNPSSGKATPSATPGPNTRDRHLLLIGSVASLLPIPGQPLYAVAKHGVLGLFRALRATSFTNGVRVNMLCPYFINTPLIPASGRLVLAGGAMGKPEAVVDAGTRFMADTRIVGRALVIGPKVRTNEEWELLSKDSEEGNETDVWEAYADDLEEVDLFTARFVRMVNAVEVARGWAGWAYDVVLALTYPLRSMF
jgi:NAD(P)-dependent dehydrogenase (short-subunit alcohol dehydrogenase family)